MKLYYAKGACSLASRIIINELELPCDYESVDLRTKQTESGKDYLAINAKGAVPALLTDDNQILTENAIIQQYLAESVHAVQLLPAVGDFKRYRVLEWLNYIATELHKSFGPLFNPNLPQDVKDQFFKPLLIAKFSYIDKHLLSKCIAGDTFTLPDAYMFVMLNWAVFFNFDFTKWPHLSNYFIELKKRDSIQKSLQQEGLK